MGHYGLGQTASIDYFATSLPNLLVFEEGLLARRAAEHLLLITLAHYGLGDHLETGPHLEKTLAFTNGDQCAADLKHQPVLTAE